MIVSIKAKARSRRRVATTRGCHVASVIAVRVPIVRSMIQAKIMWMMPIVFTGMFLFFPAGLVLYWVVNNLLSIAQQWQITRLIEGAAKK